MSTIAIVTDTDSSLPPSLADEYGIIQVPIIVHFGQQSFKAGEEIDDAQTFQRIDRDGELPSTSAPSPGDFAEAYRRALQGGAAEVICFTVSGEVSATFDAAVNAKEMVQEGPVTVVDTKSLSMGQGYMVLEAARMAQEGKTREEIITRTQGLRERTHLFAALSTLKYMAMSGRIGHLSAGMANFLNIKPILSIQDGKLDLLEKVRTQSKSWERVIELVVETLAGRELEKLSVLHVNALEDAQAFEELLAASIDTPEEVPFIELTPGLSIHAGSGLVGVTFVAAG